MNCWVFLGKHGLVGSAACRAKPKQRAEAAKGAAGLDQHGDQHGGPQAKPHVMSWEHQHPFVLHCSRVLERFCLAERIPRPPIPDRQNKNPIENSLDAQVNTMPPSQNEEIKDISQRMAHLQALLWIPQTNPETKRLSFEYSNLRARREAIEAEAETEAEAEAEAEAEVKTEAKDGRTISPEVTSGSISHMNNEAVNTQGILSVGTPRPACSSG